MLNKRGELTTEEIIEIVLGAAVVLVMAVLLYNLISPTFNRGDKISESYFDSFEEELEVADKGDIGRFSIWQPEEDKREFYLVYFQDKSVFGTGTRIFYSSGDNVNHICICSWEKRESTCSYCKNLELPVSRISFEEDYSSWAIGVGESVEIEKMEDYYEFN